MVVEAAVANMPQTAQTRRSFTMDDAIALLERTPKTLDSLLRGLPDDWMRSNEGGETWSPFDVIGHLIHGELTDWVPRARIILDHGEGRAFDKFDRFAQFEVSRGRTLDSLLDEFATLRRDNLRELAALRVTEADLDRKGRHPELGRSRCASCSRPGSRTTSITSSRSHERWRGSTPTKSARGARTCASSAAPRANGPAAASRPSRLFVGWRPFWLPHTAPLIYPFC